ncbi:MAG: VWA domain-containing protein [Acidimicrobiia bacterium]|nr:VWA domain-containing protein [Acidimicrobiia bacterium]
MTLLDVLAGFIQELREAGIPVSMVEAIDAMDALGHIELADRSAFKAALGATLVKNARHYEAFDTAFEVFFAVDRSLPGDDAETGNHEGTDRAPTASGEGRQGGQGGGGADVEALIRGLIEALSRNDRDLMRIIAGRAVDQLAGMERGRPVGGTYYLYRTLRQLAADELVQRMMDDAGDDLSDFDARLVQEEYEFRLEQFREEVRAEIRRRLVADRGREAVAKTLRKPLMEDLDLMHATRVELRQIEQAVYPLTRKLAARLAQRRRRFRKGRLDFRRTMRRSLSSGGVPIDPQFRNPRPSRPDVFLLCDISGSMATFARFTLQFVYAMSAQFSRLRSFVFVDALDEATRFFDESADFEEALARVSAEAEVVWMDGHSDYGNSLEMFWDRYGDQLTPRSAVIITGDARNNYRPPKADLLAKIANEVRAVYWLNPEPTGYWDTGDSVMRSYAEYCTDVYEVRSLRQLEQFIEDMVIPTFKTSPRRPAVVD